MNYDKNSFLSGIAVGRQIKGWATGPGQQTVSAIKAMMGYVHHQRTVIPEIILAGTLTPDGNLLTPAISVLVERSPHYDVNIGAVGTIAPASGLLSPVLFMEVEGRGHYAVRAGTADGTLAPASGIIGATASGTLIKDEE